MQLILYYAPNACSLVPYVTLTEARCVIRSTSAELPPVGAHDPGISATQPQA